MRRLFFIFVIIIFLGTNSSLNGKSETDLVRSPEVAIEIAIAVWKPLYGNKIVDRFRPYHAFLEGAQWHVTGTVPHGTLGGGSPEATIVKQDGRIMNVHLAR